MRIGETVRIIYGPSQTGPDSCEYRHGGKIRYFGRERVEVEIKSEQGIFILGIPKSWLQESNSTHWAVTLLPTE